MSKQKSHNVQAADGTWNWRQRDRRKFMLLKRTALGASPAIRGTIGDGGRVKWYVCGIPRKRGPA